MYRLKSNISLPSSNWSRTRFLLSGNDLLTSLHSNSKRQSNSKHHSKPISHTQEKIYSHSQHQTHWIGLLRSLLESNREVKERGKENKEWEKKNEKIERLYRSIEDSFAWKVLWCFEKILRRFWSKRCLNAITYS